jgi:TolB-like protein/Flp pilus assembly protein TadD
VLPIENLGAAEDEDLADGLTEAIAGKLAQVSGLSVVGRTSAMQYKKTTKPVGEIGQELKVSHVLTSTLRREGGGSSRLRIHAELVRTADGTQVWAESYETEGGGMFSVQADLAERVARALQVTLLPPEREEIAAQPTKNAEAYDAYLRGQALYTRSDDLKEVQGAIAFFGQASRLDPSFAQAFAWLSICHTLMYWYGYDSGAGRLDSATAAVERAASTAPDLPEVLLARGYLRYWGYLDYDGALTHMNKAVAARPNDPSFLAATAYVNRRRGNWDEALRLLERAIELDPRSRELAYNLGQSYNWLRRFPEAGRYLEQARVITPTDGLTITQLISLRLSEGGPEAARQVYRTAAEGRDPVDVIRGIVVWEPLWLAEFDPGFQAAIERLDLGAESDLSDSYHMLRGTARAARGEAAAARASFDSARIILEREKPAGTTAQATRHATLARVYAGLGRMADAVREAERSAEILPPSRESIGGANGLQTLAEIYMKAGQKEKAIEVLGQLLKIPSLISVPMLRNDPTWDRLRDEAGFQALLK